MRVLRWVRDRQVMTLKFEWHVLIASYVGFTVIHFEPESADARRTWSLNSLVGTIADDMFDIDGSREELLNLIQLMEK